MPRAGLTGDDAVASAAGLADEIGFQGRVEDHGHDLITEQVGLTS